MIERARAASVIENLRHNPVKVCRSAIGMYTRPRLRLVLVVLATGLCVATLVYLMLLRSRYPDPEAALAAFYGGEPRPECMQADPLRSEGQGVVPLVLRDLPNKSMPRRRYAIGFLGEGRYKEALPALERILADLTEIDYFRADALLAIYAIAPTRAQSLAPSIQNPTGLLRRRVEEIEREDLRLKEMTYPPSC